MTSAATEMAAPADRNEISELAYPYDVKKDFASLTGQEKAAIFLLALGREHGQPIWAELDDEEVAEISQTMSRLGNIRPELVEYIFGEFISQMSLSGALHGNYETTERLLAQYLPEDRLAHIMEEIRGPAGRNMWEKLSNVPIPVLTNYLKNEYPQTVAVILSRIATDHAAGVLAALPEEFSMEVVQRMLAMEPVHRDIVDKIEDTLRSEFIANLTSSRQRNSHELMAEIFNNFDRQTESRFLGKLDEIDREASEQIKSLMFTFDDLMKLDNVSVQTLLRHVEKQTLTLALKGTSEKSREFFISNMSERAGNMLRDDLEAMGPVRLKEVDEAQSMMINTAKDLAEKGEITISTGAGEDELVY
jgi:flagellar motor switch protein FliG